MQREDQTLLIPAEQHTDFLVVPKSKLLVVAGPLQGREFIVDKEFFCIGSGPSNDLVLDDLTISRNHCEIRLLPEGHLIRDLGSTNGTAVQGVRVTEAFLAQGTEFQLGKTRIVFCPLQESIEYPLSPNEAFGDLIGKSIPMRRIFHIAETYAPSDATVLIHGETGTGKEVLAEEIHKHSKRRDKPFTIIDCTSLARELVESELFGHAKGSFTGANTERMGAFEQANGGTVFMDEIGELIPELQPKLLRVLEKRAVRRVGSNQVRPVDVRIIAATNKKLINEVNAGSFREDLYFRLSVVLLELQPLRLRKADIPLLTQKFMANFLGAGWEKEVTEFDRTMEIFGRHDWPGNVRELRNLIELACYSEIRPLNLGTFLCYGHMAGPNGSQRMTHGADRPFKEAKNDLIREFESDYLRDLLSQHGGNISRAAREAGIERAYLQRLIRKHNIKT